MEETQNPKARVAVVVATLGRPEVVSRLVTDLAAQTRRPDEVVLCSPDSGSIPDSLPADARVSVVHSEKGSSRQRNAALATLSEDTDIVVFLDDDTVPRNDFVEKVVAGLASSPDWVGVTGRVVLDGAALGRQLSSEEMAAALERSRDDETGTPQPVYSLYGCNMAVRFRIVRERDIRFDERLPLYGWLEDLDFSRRCARYGVLSSDPACVVAHQGSGTGGRTSHVRFGYSSIVNPVYLWRKGSLRAQDLPRLIGRPLLGSLAGAFTSAARRQRLQGMARGLADMVRGRVEPERMADLS